MTNIQRSQFIPETIWIASEDGWKIPLHRSDNPDEWLRIVNSDKPVVTQVDDGNLTDGKGIQPSSSSSAPAAMRRMLDLLDVRKGHAVLEVGAGTGFNAAMLAEIAGPDKVVTVEVDKTISDHARMALQRAGFPDVLVIHGDGALGHHGRAPYDRVMFTASLHTFPYPVVEQTVPGGRILAPWASTWDSGGILIPLDVIEQGVAQGRFASEVGFMRLREQRPAVVWWGDDEYDGHYDESPARRDLREVFTPLAPSRFAIGAKLPGLVEGKTRNEDGSFTYRLSDSESQSWASCTPDDKIRQHGPRRLWDEFEAAYDWWVAHGEPDYERFGLTVTQGGQQVWLDTPSTTICL